MVQYDCKESEGVFLWVLYKGVYIRGSLEGYILTRYTTQRTHTDHTTHRETDRPVCDS
jgi:hypothetical protein